MGWGKLPLTGIANPSLIQIISINERTFTIMSRELVLVWFFLPKPFISLLQTLNSLLWESLAVQLCCLCYIGTALERQIHPSSFQRTFGATISPEWAKAGWPGTRTVASHGPRGSSVISCSPAAHLTQHL